VQSIATADEFMARLPEFDAHFAELNAAAEARQEVLRYVGVVDPSGKSAAQLKRCVLLCIDRL
jgi:homoserine dehydrogenase